MVVNVEVFNRKMEEIPSHDCVAEVERLQFSSTMFPPSVEE